MGKIISIAIPKGGVGKTTTAVNLSLALTKKKKKVLLIDVDPSGQCLSSFNIDKSLSKGNIFDVFTSSKKLSEVIYSTEYLNLDCIPMKRSTYQNELRLSNLAERSLNLKYEIRSLAVNYDFVFIDCPPSLTGTTANILNISDSVLIPLKASKYSLDELERIFKFINEIKKTGNSALVIEGIVLTIDEPKTKISHLVKRELLQKYPNMVFNVTIPKTVKVEEASFDKTPIIIYDADSACSKAYLKLADEIILRNEMSDLFFKQ